MEGMGEQGGEEHAGTGTTWLGVLEEPDSGALTLSPKFPPHVPMGH